MEERTQMWRWNDPEEATEPVMVAKIEELMLEDMWVNNFLANEINTNRGSTYMFHDIKYTSKMVAKRVSELLIPFHKQCVECA